MARKFIYLLSLFLLALITGVFWGTWFTLTRSIEDFSPDEFIHIGKVIISNVAIPMRIIMPLGILFMLLSVLIYRQKGTVGFYTGVLSLVLVIAVLLITLIVLVPIDNDIKAWTASSLPADFEAIRLKWKNFHAARTFLSLASFLCFTFFMLNDRDKR